MQHHDVGRFDEWAPTYEQHWMQKRFFAPLQAVALDLAAEQVPRPSALLDIGCGTGRLLRALQLRFRDARLDGVDAAPAMVRQAISMLPEGSPIHVQNATAEDLPFPDGVFDLAFSTMTFHHWADQEKGIAEVRRVLAPGGRWILAEFVATGLMGLISRVFRVRRFPRRARLDAMLSRSGLRILAQRPVPGTMGNVQVLVIGARNPTP